ncbi:hypothetical protein KDU71_07615 [Carboxylicivirga sediminis]|uniref:Uncharacterized protein n=1 Tax=Carboxylicivirga sediminis TaxID=2006564 RepID=A0A941IXI2_9BACT|nr:hypothetical protein [Carboxylicivirga sediminis]MBR8535424.1 hypothetical protein [Carboxylicivirga sediminis]
MSNFKDITVSFANLVKSRGKNPFYGTLVLVYIFRNYKEIYQLFFIKQTTLSSRLEILDTLLSSEVFVKELSKTILVTFAAMLVSYVLINLSELLKGVFKNVINVWVSKLIDLITDKTNTYSKDDYNELNDLKNDFEKRYNAEREKRLRSENEVDELEKRVKELLNPDEFNSILHKKISDKNLINPFRTIRDLVNEKKPLVNFPPEENQLLEILKKERVIKLIDEKNRIYDFTNPKGESYVEFFNNWEDSPSALGIN